MEDVLKLGLRATGQTAPSKVRTRPSRAVLRARAQRLVSHATSAKVNMGEGYGTDVTDLPSADYKARIRRLMMRG